MNKISLVWEGACPISSISQVQPSIIAAARQISIALSSIYALTSVVSPRTSMDITASSATTLLLVPPRILPTLTRVIPPLCREIPASPTTAWAAAKTAFLPISGKPPAWADLPLKYTSYLQVASEPYVPGVMSPSSAELSGATWVPAK